MRGFFRWNLGESLELQVMAQVWQCEVKEHLGQDRGIGRVSDGIIVNENEKVA